MNNSKVLAVSVLFMALALFACAGVMYSQYVKVATFSCYYGYDPAGSLATPNTRLTPNSVFVNGSWQSLDNIKCVNESESSFSCPSTFASTNLEGYQYVTLDAVAGLLEARNTFVYKHYNPTTQETYDDSDPYSREGYYTVEASTY